MADGGAWRPIRAHERPKFPWSERYAVRAVPNCLIRALVLTEREYGTFEPHRRR